MLQGAAALLAVLYLNTALAFQNLWPTPWPRPALELGLELLLLLGVLAVLRTRGIRLGRRGRGLLAAIFLLASVLRYIEVSAPPLFGRALNLYWDLRHLPNLLELFWRTVPAVSILLIGLAVLILLSVVFLLNRAALATVDRALTDGGLRRIAMALPVLAAMMLAISLIPGLDGLRRAYAIPVSVIAGKHVMQVAEAVRLLGAEPAVRDALLGPPLPETADLSGLQGDDLLVVFLESYGATLFDTPDYAEALQAPLDGLEQRLAAAGWYSASRRVISPTFGGGSWLAHGALLGGAHLTDQTRYNLFLSAGRSTLVRLFGAAGYRTVAVLPGTQRLWPEGEAFGFDAIYDAEALGYPGPDFGYWRIPDQFTLHRFRELELATPRDPLFALVVLITTHMPFHPLPPYVADWSRLGDGTAYDAAATAALVEQEVDWDSLGERYVDSMSRSLRILGDFLATAVPDDALVVLLGDHQPPALVAGKKQPWSVPIHLLSKDPVRLHGFLERGYRPGLKPPPEDDALMAGFARDVLAVFGAVSRSE